MRSEDRSLTMLGRVRGILIAYGVAAFTWFFSQRIPQPTPDASPGALSPIAIGLLVQILLFVARIAVKRYERENAMDGELYPRAMYIIELLADGVTVLLFAVGTFRAILGAVPEL
jgi:hypothetical protein